jgi:hypothetical protein
MLDIYYAYVTTSNAKALLHAWRASSDVLIYCSRPD